MCVWGDMCRVCVRVVNETCGRGLCAAIPDLVTVPVLVLTLVLVSISILLLILAPMLLILCRPAVLVLIPSLALGFF